MKRIAALATLVFAGACSSPPAETAGPTPTMTALPAATAPEIAVEPAPSAGDPRPLGVRAVATTSSRQLASPTSSTAALPAPSAAGATPATSSTTVTTTWLVPVTAPPTTTTTSVPQATTTTTATLAPTPTTTTTTTIATTTTTARAPFECQAHYFNVGGNYPHRFWLSSNWADIRVWVEYIYSDGWSPYETGATPGYEIGTSSDGSSEQSIPAGWEKRQPVLRFKPRPWTHGQPDTGWACEMKLPPL